jgi:transcriptional regulator with PAS, ATPase and Fis domain
MRQSQQDKGNLLVSSGETFGFEDIVHNSLEIRNLIALVRKVAPTEATVLITGESGTGKEVFAKALHYSSHRSAGPFVAINCAAVPDTLLEAELFGHQKGAFTGAVSTRIGKFEAANRGTLFLDEIGDMSLPAQAKILRAIQERAIQRVGGNELIPVDIRIACATHQKLTEMVANGQFRQDLYYRLHEVGVDIPPLRLRLDDLEPLIQHFIRIYTKRYGKEVQSISPAAFQVLRRHPWPGNIRELEHMIHHAVLMAEGDTIWVEHLPTTSFMTSIVRAPMEIEEDSDGRPLELLSLEDVESLHLKRVLKHCNWNKTKAAGILKISRPTLDRKIDKFGLKRE